MTTLLPPAVRLAPPPAAATPRAGRLPFISRLIRDTTGTAVIETAIIMPALIMLVYGAISWGVWFGMAHALQQAANEGARAALEGMNAGERTKLVKRAITANTGTLISASGVKLATSLVDRNFTVVLHYDLSNQPFFAESLVPIPVAIHRSATVQLYGA